MFIYGGRVKENRRNVLAEEGPVWNCIPERGFFLEIEGNTERKRFNMKWDLKQEYTEVVKNNPFAAQLGIEIMEIREGYVHARVKKKKELENVYGDLHGGCLYTVADNMAGIASSTYGYYVTTVSGTIQYLHAARNTEFIFCEAEVIKHGKTIDAVHVKITDDNGLLLNTADFTFFNLRKREGA